MQRPPHALRHPPPLPSPPPRLGSPWAKWQRRRGGARAGVVVRRCGGLMTQHCRIYDVHGLAPTVSTTSAINVWADETRVRLLQPRELARLQGLNHFHLPTGRVVATRLIGNAIPPALVVALFK